MNIVFLSTSDSGGAGKAAYSIYSILKRVHDCKFIVFRKDTSHSDVYEVNNVKKTVHFLYWIFNKILDKITFTRFKIDDKYDMLNLMERAPYFNIKKLFSIIEKKPDLMIFNWITGFINSRDIKILYEKYHVPIIWILHDYAPLTGGCHIAWNCQGFTKSCGNCPGLNSTTKNDYTNKIHRNKAKNLLDLPVFTTGWSDFILSKSHLSSLFKSRTLIPITPGIDKDLFSPGKDKKLSKEMLYISSYDKVVLFGAQNVFSEYKGFKHILSALNVISEYLQPGITFCLLTFGRAEEELNLPINFKCISLGELANPVPAYQAADVFVAPTLQDTGPMTVCEALMCGVPVIGYPMGIIPGIIRESETGFIVAEGNIKLLAEKIAIILNLSQDKYDKISMNCRNDAMTRCSKEAQLESFNTIFNLLTPDKVSSEKE